MKVPFWLRAAVIFSIFVSCGNAAFGKMGPPQKNLKEYALHGDPNSADISPDEQLVVTENTVRMDADELGTKLFAEVVELWNFKQGKLVAESRLRLVAAKKFPKGYFRDPIYWRRIVKFSPDGKSVIALVGHNIYVLQASDLSTTQTISLLEPRAIVMSARGTKLVQQPRVAAMAIAPKGNMAAVLWVVGLSLHGTIDVYDLSTGSRVQSWKTPQGWVNFTKSLSWTSDGKFLVVGIPNNTPCGSPFDGPDIFAFDPYTGAIEHQLNTGLLVGDIATTTANRVLAVDFNCLGVFENHHPKLRVFDILTGKRLKELSGRGTGVRYIVSISADGRRCLAYTGKMGVKFDWGDMVPDDKVEDETFSVWDLSNYHGIVTSQNIPGLRASGLRISPKGHYAVSYGKASFVYQLP